MECPYYCSERLDKPPVLIGLNNNNWQIVRYYCCRRSLASLLDDDGGADDDEDNRAPMDCRNTSQVPTGNSTVKCSNN